jgi:hypothetical protein
VAQLGALAAILTSGTTHWAARLRIIAPNRPGGISWRRCGGLCRPALSQLSGVRQVRRGWAKTVLVAAKMADLPAAGRLMSEV